MDKKDKKAKSNKKIIIAIIITAAVIIMTAGGFLVYKKLSKPANNQPTEPKELNVTLFRFHMGKELTDVHVSEIKAFLTEVTGDKILNISVKSIPLPGTQYLLNEAGDAYIEVGDAVDIVFSILDETEKTNMFYAFVEEYGLNEIFGEHVTSVYEIKDLYRADYE